MNINNTTYRIYNQRSQQWLLEDATILDIALSDNQELRNAMAHDQYAEEDEHILVWQECLVRETDTETYELQGFYEGDIVAFNLTDNEQEKIGVVRKSFFCHAKIETGHIEETDSGAFEVTEVFPWSEILASKKRVIGNIFNHSIAGLEENRAPLTQDGF